MKAIPIFLLLIGISSAIGGPAGVVLDSQKISAPSIDLRGIDPTVFNASEFTNEPLGDPHYFWDRQYITQNDTPDAMNLVNWSAEWVELPESFARS